LGQIGGPDVIAGRPRVRQEQDVAAPGFVRTGHRVMVAGTMRQRLCGLQPMSPLISAQTVISRPGWPGSAWQTRSVMSASIGVKG
jgi:hypothetical protein